PAPADGEELARAQHARTGHSILVGGDEQVRRSHLPREPRAVERGYEVVGERVAEQPRHVGTVPRASRAARGASRPPRPAAPPDGRREDPEPRQRARGARPRSRSGGPRRARGPGGGAPRGSRPQPGTRDSWRGPT